MILGPRSQHFFLVIPIVCTVFFFYFLFHFYLCVCVHDNLTIKRHKAGFIQDYCNREGNHLPEPEGPMGSWNQQGG